MQSIKALSKNGSKNRECLCCIAASSPEIPHIQGVRGRISRLNPSMSHCLRHAYANILDFLSVVRSAEVSRRSSRAKRSTTPRSTMPACTACLRNAPPQSASPFHLRSGWFSASRAFGAEGRLKPLIKLAARVSVPPIKLYRMFNLAYSCEASM